MRSGRSRGSPIDHLLRAVVSYLHPASTARFAVSPAEFISADMRSRP